MQSNVAYEEHVDLQVQLTGEDEKIGEAFLDESVVTYWFWAIFVMMIVTVIGIPFLPFWLCFGCCLCRQYFESVKITITKRSLVCESGGVCCHCVPHSVKTILLDRIQDVSISQNCLERCFGVQRLTVETAGQQGPNGGPELSFTGISNTKEFRDAVLSQRHYYVENASNMSGGTGLQGQKIDSMNQTVTVDVLTEIRDALLRIETRPAQNPTF